MVFKKFLKRPIKANLVVIDSQFPQKSPFAFRNAEINEYLKRLPDFQSYTMYPMPPDEDAWITHSYGIEKPVFLENKQGYLSFYPENGSRIHYLEKTRDYQFNLSYSYFLGETYVLLPFLEAHHIPFVFVLYPGGCFGLDFDGSDQMLRKLFQSPWFRGVIVTQKLTHDYLLRKKLCPPKKIEYIYGGFVQFKKQDLKPKQFFKKDKQTFDICFVAAKYTEKGVDKGYDLFITVAKKLCKQTKDIMFHVVGGFDEQEIDIRGYEDRITFYGYQRPDFLSEFYAKMDIFLAPGRPFKIFPGNFDGFPLGIDAGYCGTALFVSDELHMNQHYQDGKDLIIIPLQAAKITDKILYYYRHLDEFYELSRRGQKTIQRLFDIDHQIEQRLTFFRKFVKLDE